MSKIEWTDLTRNIQIGCTRKSLGCERCYAEALASSHATRFGKVEGHPHQRYLHVVDGKGRWNREVLLDEAALARPPHGSAPHGHGIPKRVRDGDGWRRPRVFLGSMTDHFHEDVTPAMFLSVLRWASRAPSVIWQVVTKRPERAPELLRAATEWWVTEGPEDGRPFPTIHLLATVEDQERADERVPHLLEAAPYVDLVGLSVEPLLGPVTIPQAEKLGWVIVGGESGKRARRCDVAWIRSVVAQCKGAGVPVFVKQLGADPRWPEAEIGAREDWGLLKDSKGGNQDEWPADLRVRQWPA